MERRCYESSAGPDHDLCQARVSAVRCWIKNFYAAGSNYDWGDTVLGQSICLYFGIPVAKFNPFPVTSNLYV